MSETRPISVQSLPPTPLSARGVGPTWITGLALVVCTIMILGLLAMIVVGGGKTFWQKPVEEVTLGPDEAFLGMVYGEGETPEGESQVLYRVGNRDLGQQPFRWVDEADIQSRATPDEVLLLEREEWGIWLGVPERIFEITPAGEIEVIAEGPDAVLGQLEDQLELAEERRENAEAIRSGPIAEINDQLEQLRLEELEAQIRADGTERPRLLGWPGWGVVLAIAIAALILAWRTDRDSVRRAGVVVGAVLLLAAYVERPWAGKPWSPEQLAEFRLETEAEREMLRAEFTEYTEELAALEADDARFRIEVRDVASGQFAPISRSRMSDPMKVSQILRAVPANELGVGDKIALYLSRWWEFLSEDPREANTEGGVFPVIVGTLLVTLLLTIAVVPLGVLAALYMREYARQGAVISILRVAINNLAGVPSIVYGVFGLGFFCYGIGGVIDGGTDPAMMLGAAQWWALVLVVGAMLFVAMTLAGQDRKNRKTLVMFGVWTGLAILAVVAVFTTPYFNGFFRAKLLDGSPTFGTSGLLWASLTLALLTLPVVIVSAEEAIAAVPASLREGSYGCGASKWQTIQRVVLPSAMPGILTGAILAMARGAGEVAPLMIVGAVKLAPELPFEDRFPFIFADRSFMHLGFHIFDLGFKSPDSEAARGYVWTTTLLLVTLVVMMNLIAIRVRTRLKNRFVSGQF